MTPRYSVEMRKKIRKRDNNSCFFCLTNKNLTVAHIFVWRKDGGRPVEKNGMCLCRDCHDKLDFGIGITRQQQIKMLRLCQMYLTFMYMQEIKDEEVTFQKVKRGVM